MDGPLGADLGKPKKIHQITPKELPLPGALPAMPTPKPVEEPVPALV